MNKIYKPGECMKYMYIEMHPALAEAWYCSDVKREVSAVGAKVTADTDVCDPALVLWSRAVQPQLASNDGQNMHKEMHPALAEAWYCSDVKREVSAVGAKVTIDCDVCDPALVLWSRAVQPELANNDGQVELTSRRERCDHALYVLCADDVAEYVMKRSLAQHIAQLTDMVACTITLVVFGTKDYFKKSGRSTQNSGRKLMTEIELEMVVTDLIVSANCDTVMVDSPNDLALLITQFTKAIAEAPHKKAKRESDEQAEFYMRGENKQCVAIDKNGNGMSRLWQQMIAVLPQSSLETSRAICGEYKTPRELYEVLNSQNAVNEVADVGVARAAVPGARARRVGPEFARKLHTLFTSDDGSALIE